MPTVKTEESCRDGLLCRRILQSVDNGLRVGIHPLWAFATVGEAPIMVQKIPTAIVLVRLTPHSWRQIPCGRDNKGDLRYGFHHRL